MRGCCSFGMDNKFHFVDQDLDVFYADSDSEADSGSEVSTSYVSLLHILLGQKGGKVS